MKRTLLFFTLLAAMGAGAQTVNSFYPLTTTPANYRLTTSDPALDETPAGENVTWNFTSLASYGTSVTNVGEPTTEQLAEYPGITAVVNTASEGETASEFFLTTADNGGVTLTGASSGGIELNYNTNPLDLGTFPKSFSSSAIVDDVAGGYNADGLSGTFSGVATTVVDGYGTLNVSIDNGTEVSIAVTRLKIVQDLDLYFSGAVIGTLVQTMYSYHAETPANSPVFRTITAAVSLPAFGVNEIQTSIESYFEPTAGGPDTAAPLVLSIAPNPVNNVLHITGDTQVASFTVLDAMGRTVLNASGNYADVSSLSPGIYTILVTAQGGTKTLKMAKQ